jgi:hypothetical protein
VDKDTTVLTYAHMQALSVGNEAVGVEACAYTSAGEKNWCTAVSPIPPRDAPGTTWPSATGAAGHVALGVPGFGILAVDGAAKTAPELLMVYDQGAKDDCCVPTAVEVVTELAGGPDDAEATAVATVVASIPIGTMQGIWCQCQGSKVSRPALASSAALCR